MSGDRIKLARKKAGFSLRALAEAMENLVSAQALGKYERGEMRPSSDVLIRLSKALGVSQTYLLAAQGIRLGGVQFRTKSNTSGKDRARIETEVIEWIERYLQIEEILETSGDSWRCPPGMPQKLATFEEAERLADKLRAHWKLGIDPIPDMTELLEDRGIKVLLGNFTEKMSGQTCVVNQQDSDRQIPVIVINRSKSLERRRFTMAHELAHRVIDPSSPDIEGLCNRFAGAFLVNREHLLREIGERRSQFSVREIMELKRLYRVSASSFLMRLEQVGALVGGALSHAFRTFAQPWRAKEPEPLPIDDEIPKRFERLVYRAVAEDMISISKAVELLRVPRTEVEKGLKGPAEVEARHR